MIIFGKSISGSIYSNVILTARHDLGRAGLESGKPWQWLAGQSPKHHQCSFLHLRVHQNRGSNIHFLALLWVSFSREDIIEN